MEKLLVRLIDEGSQSGKIPLYIALVDKKDIIRAGITTREAVACIANEINGPVGINIFDLDAVTTTSDGIVVEGAIVAMAAGDGGRVHKEFGILDMEEIFVTDDLIKEEPHLLQWKASYPGKKFFRGPNPDKKLIPVHNAVMTGRAVNNNSATEMMNVVTMEEILLPILGQLQLMKDERVIFGMTGEHISVGIGMTVAEKFGRVFPHRQFRAGDTAHGSGEYAKTLKKDIPCIVASKDVLASYIMRALETGLVPGIHLGCSPAVLAVAKARGFRIGVENITQKAVSELESIGMGLDYMSSAVEIMSEDDVLNKADEIIPGVEEAKGLDAADIVRKIHISV